MLQQLARLMMAKHLISPMWLEEMNSDADDADDDASVCNDSKTALLLLLGEYSQQFLLSTH